MLYTLTDMEREHYSNKGSHFLRGQAHKFEQQTMKEGFSVPFAEVKFEQRRFMPRMPREGKRRGR